MQEVPDNSSNTTPVPSGPRPWLRTIGSVENPAVPPTFLLRREGYLSDGSVDPSTANPANLHALLATADISPNHSNTVPTAQILEAIHQRNLKLPNETAPLIPPTQSTSPTSIYQKTVSGDQNSMTSAANQTASELAAINILFGGVKGKAYLETLHEFIAGCGAEGSGRVAQLLRDRLDQVESICGYKVLAATAPTDPQSIWQAILQNGNTNMTISDLLTQNEQIIALLRVPGSIDVELRTELMVRLRTNLDVILKHSEVPTEALQGVDLTTFRRPIQK